MAGTWTTSWGTLWGSSWGLEAPVVVPVVSTESDIIGPGYPANLRALEKRYSGQGAPQNLPETQLERLQREDEELISIFEALCS